MYISVTNTFGRTVSLNTKQIHYAHYSEKDALFLDFSGLGGSATTTDRTEIIAILTVLAEEPNYLDLRGSNGYGYLINLSAIFSVDVAPQASTIFIYFSQPTPSIKLDISYLSVINDALANYVEASGTGGGARWMRRRQI